MDIIFSINNNESVRVLPICPEVVVTSPQENSEFDGLKGKMAIIGPKGRRSLSISSYFPSKSSPLIHAGASSNGWSYVEWFEQCRDRMLPMRVVIVYEYYKLNMACLIDDFSWHVDSSGDYVYDLSASEYIFATAKPVQNVEENVVVTYPVVGEGTVQPGGVG